MDQYQQQNYFKFGITNMTDFSIDYILNRAGEKYMGTNFSISLSDRIKLKTESPEHCGHFKTGVLQNQAQEIQQQNLMFDWLQYTRYHPPKLPRSFRSGPVKRTPGRLPRVPFTPAQLQALENAYSISTYLSSEDANNLAAKLDLTNTRVKIWFQNRRARERREKREQNLSSGTEAGCDSTMSSTSSSPEPEISNYSFKEKFC
ncbi:homeobox protein MSX-1 [Episyrphus balteatus]|uniref:homeobox protein MSX-1 n=1 Tax=Episyrphus balteatus TaxID=286459 RepID=UPI002486C455|nr:homeobox protein MSX-1 [Episyrphus balteatus]